MSTPGPPVWPLVAWPAAITLAVTLLRLTGELLHWSPAAYSRLPGGVSTVGITWLVPLFGFYFGWKMRRAGAAPASLSRAAALPVVALLGIPAAVWLAERVRETSWTGHLALWAGASLLAAGVAVTAWPALGRLLLAYALLARLPVALVAAAAIWRQWGTHFDAPPPRVPPMTPLARWLWTGLLPQATIWVALTIGVGALAGALGWLAARRPRRPGGR